MAAKIALTICALLLAADLCAHTNSLSYSEITVDNHDVRIRLRVPLPELDLLLALDSNFDSNIEEREVAARLDDIKSYLAEKVRVSAAERVLPMELLGTKRWQDAGGKPYLEFDLSFESEPLIGRFAINCNLFDQVVHDHKNLAALSVGGRIEQFVFEYGRPYEGNLAEARGVWGNLATFIVLGIEHIFTGYDHLMFLLGLLLVGAGLRDLVKIVTSFTVAHSITLISAALDYFSLPARLVESGIALSIAYVGLENILMKRFERRWLITFGFGLIHGFGFAGVLREMELPAKGLASSLFSFNLGVEIGQIAIVSLVFPLILYMRRTPASPLLVKSISCVIVLFGLFWFYQRAFA